MKLPRMLLAQPDGLHIICLGKTADFQSGDRIPLSLTFAEAGELSVEAEIHQKVA